MPKKLTQEDADKIRLLKKGGFTLKEISKRYNVSTATISYIINNLMWVQK